MVVESLAANATTIGLGGIAGFLIGYAVKKIMKILAVIVGISLAALIYLQSQQIINIQWIKLQHSISTYALSSTTAMASMIDSSIPLTSAAAGFAIGFMKG